jgi:hypothetical protein
MDKFPNPTERLDQIIDGIKAHFEVDSSQFCAVNLEAALVQRTKQFQPSESVTKLESKMTKFFRDSLKIKSKYLAGKLTMVLNRMLGIVDGIMETKTIPLKERLAKAAELHQLRLELSHKRDLYTQELLQHMSEERERVKEELRNYIIIHSEKIIDKCKDKEVREKWRIYISMLSPNTHSSLKTFNWTATDEV